MTLDKKLARLRKKEGLSQAEVSEKLDVSRQAVSRWEAGVSRPSTENLQALCKLYNVQMDYLLDDDKDALFEKDVSPVKLEGNLKTVNKKKIFILVAIGILALICCAAILVAFKEESQKNLNLEEIPGEVMPATESDFSLTWYD